ncbi:DUF6443 domain-containing protein [Mucilaginibacter sp. OK268]|uniref:DUF6443 domain-containing protein n=1 Tax=Mucilaginibacter sp. OK268 TaxID=1881048 RepID=UPI0015A1733A|nr:DUF6443 domain-containing protein [Mucilaginibacter sp. OK268]
MYRKLNTWFLSITICFTAGQVTAQSKNFVQDEVVKIPGVVSVTQLPGLTVTQKQTTKIYFDGLGRVTQTVAVQASPSQKDIIRPVVYNSLGQLTKGLLPYVGADGGGSYRPNAVTTEQASFYNNGVGDKVADDSLPFNQQVFEKSPLQRILRSGLVGAGFQPTGATGTQHYKTAVYRSNTSAADGNIIIWGADATNKGNYADNTLSVTDGKDEDGVETLSFIDLNGKAILKRQKNGATNLDTYYIYNNAGMISYVIPPLALNTMVAGNNYDPNQAVVNKLVFKYVYDDRERVVEKTMPNAGVIYMIYDPLNRPVLIQDAKLRMVNQWNYIKYDNKDHAIGQGIYTDATNTTRMAMQTYVTSGTIAANYSATWYESRSTAAATGYYSNAVFPTSNITPLAYSYYDDYDIDGNGSANYTYSVQSLTNESSPTAAAIKGVPTMVSTRSVGSGLSSIWLLKVMFYDKSGHVIQTQSNNQLNYTAGVITDYSTSAPDFIGTPKQTKIVKVTGTTAAPITTSVMTTMSYDHMYRVIAIDQSYNGGAAVHVAAYTYNELGQLVQKNLQPGTAAAAQDITLNGNNSVASGATLNVTAGNSITLSPGFSAASGSTFTANISSGALQSIDYRYNIRGQLISINNSKLANDSGTTNTNDDSTDLFGMQLLYDQTDSNLGNTPWFSGKLSAVKWMSKDANGTAGNERSYKYSYDALSRYTGSSYAERTASSTGAFNVNVNGFNENAISYDVGGNLLTLKRNSIPTGGGAATEFDNLTYAYDAANPNQLKSVTDDTGSNYTAYGFRNLSGTTTGSYAYDVNGNLTADPYKALTLDYNILNRTDKITITSATGRYITYTYNSAGKMIRKQQFDNNALQVTTDYIDGFVYLNSTLSYFGMPEGRVRNTGGALKPEYIISDQQGNARISLEESNTAPGTAIVRQENSYYGFGLVMPGSLVATPTTDNKQLYNGGSEWQKDFGNLPDYYQTFYRNYDAALGRFIGIDPESESSVGITTYNYAGNNPIMFNDPLGDEPAPIAPTWSSLDYLNSAYAGAIQESANLYNQMIANEGGFYASFNSGGWDATTALGHLMNDRIARNGGYADRNGIIYFHGNGIAIRAGLAYNSMWGITSLQIPGLAGSLAEAYDNYNSNPDRKGPGLYLTPEAEPNRPKDFFNFYGLDANSNSLVYNGVSGYGMSREFTVSPSDDDENSKANTVSKWTGILDNATTATSIIKFFGEESGKIKWTGKAVFGAFADVTGLASIGNSVYSAGKAWKKGDKVGAVWNTVKAAGTIGFMVFGGEEATLTVKGLEVIWNLGATWLDYKTGN